MKKNFIYFYGGAIGGFLLAIYLLENIRGNFKKENNRYIVVVPGNKSLYEELILKYPYIEIIELGKKDFFKNLLKFKPMLFGENYIFTAPAFSPQPLYKKIIGFCLKIFRKKSVLIGFDNKSINDRFFYTKLIERSDVERNVFDLMKDIIFSIGLRIIKENPDLDFIKDEQVLTKFSLNRDSYVVIHPFAANKLRSFPFDRWSRIIEYLSKKDSPLKLVVTGSEQDEKDSDLILRKIKSNKIINLSGKMNLQELMNVLYFSKFYIGVDTGVTHLAGMFQKQSLVFGNYSNPCWLPYYNLNAKVIMNRDNCTCEGNKRGECSFSYKKEKYLRCIFDISEEEVKRNLDLIFK